MSAVHINLRRSCGMPVTQDVYERRVTGTWFCVPCGACIGTTKDALLWHEHTPEHKAKFFAWAFHIGRTWAADWQPLKTPQKELVVEAPKEVERG